MTHDAYGEEIRNIVEKLLEDSSVQKIAVDQPLAGLIDSFALIELLGLLEQRHQIKFQNEHMAKENWVSFSAIGRLVESLVAQRPRGNGAVSSVK